MFIFKFRVTYLDKLSNGTSFHGTDTVRGWTIAGGSGGSRGDMTGPCGIGVEEMVGRGLTDGDWMDRESWKKKATRSRRVSQNPVENYSGGFC